MTPMSIQEKTLALVFSDVNTELERQIRPELVLMQNSGQVDHDIQISVVDPLCEMDGRERECRYIEEVLDCIEKEILEISRDMH